MAQSVPSNSGVVVRIIGGWHTECGACGFGKGGWAASPALKDPPQEPLHTKSPVCNGCGQMFTHELSVYHDLRPRPIEGARDAA